MATDLINVRQLRHKLEHDFHSIKAIGKGPQTFSEYLRDCLTVLDEREKDVKLYHTGGNIGLSETRATLDLIDETRRKIKEIEPDLKRIVVSH